MKRLHALDGHGKSAWSAWLTRVLGVPAAGLSALFLSLALTGCEPQRDDADPADPPPAEEHEQEEV